MRKVIFLPSELVESPHLIAVHDGLPKIATLLQMRARLRSAGDDSKGPAIHWPEIPLAAPARRLERFPDKRESGACRKSISRALRTDQGQVSKWERCERRRDVIDYA
jgi:hypothetical protein